MTLRRFTSIVASLMLTVFAIGGQETHGSQVAPPDEKRIQGPWQAVQIELAGKQAPEVAKKLKMLFQANKFLLDDGSARGGAFKLGTKAEPKTIEMHPKMSHEVLWGIYRFEGNRLILCLTRKGIPRPTKFQSGPKFMLITLKQGTASDKELLAKKLNQALDPQLETINNLRNLGISLHQYQADHNVFPVPVADKNGKPLLSWRVALLDYVAADVKAYADLKLDEPWDSKHNLKFLAKMPRIFRSPHRDKEKNPSSTYFVGFKGPGGVLGGPKGIRITSISNNNGTAKTILVAEARDPVPWTKPVDIEFTPNKPLPPLGNPETKQIFALFADAHIHKLPIDYKHLKLMIRYDNKTPFKLP